MMTKVFAKKLFGVKYEKVMRSIIICIAVFYGLYSAEVHLTIAPFILYFMVSVLTVGEMWQAMAADDNTANMTNLFMLPFSDRSFVVSYVSCLGAYIFLSKTMLLLAVVFAVIPFQVLTVITTLLCVINATLLSAGAFAWKKYRVLAACWMAGMVFAFYFLSSGILLLSLLLISSLIAFGMLLLTDAYAFYLGEGKKKKVIKGSARHSVWRYIFRYMTAHKNYLTNTGFIWIVAAVLPTFFKQLIATDDGVIGFIVPMGFAILSLNTPICILLSCDSSLEQAVRFLPGQKKAFFVPYCLFIFVCNLIANTIYFISVQVQLGSATGTLALAAVFFALQSAVLSVLLEWFCPLRNWKIENDLWHHPRKYVVPVVMVLLSGVIGLSPATVVVLCGILFAEVMVLFLKCCRE